MRPHALIAVARDDAARVCILFPIATVRRTRRAF